MINKIKKKFWKYLIPKIHKKLSRYNNVVIFKTKTKILNSLQSAGEGCTLNGESWIIRYPKKVILGNNVHIGNNFFAAADGGLIIGDNVHISRNVTVYTVNHNYKGKALPYDNTTIYKPVIISENVWIGMNVSILPGVKIGEGAILGMGSVINRDIEPLEIVGNNSLKKLKYRDESHYFELKSFNKYGGINGRPLESDYRPIVSYFDNKNEPIVFILGTGRSGTKSIVETLNESSQCKAFHENIPQLIRLSTKIAERQYIDDQFYELKKIFENKIWQAQEGQLLVHSDQRLWNLIPFLADYFPNSLFIHIEREKEACVRSMLARNWYKTDEYPVDSTHDWSKYRLEADRINDMKNNEWHSLSPKERCSWYWEKLNSEIASEGIKLGSNRYKHFRLSDLNDSIKPLLDFIGLKEDLSIKHVNKVRKKDLHRYENRR